MVSGSSAEHIDSDERLNAIRANDPAALRQLYQQNYPAVERYVVQNSGSAEQAKDIYQEAFLATWRNLQLGRFQSQPGAGIDAYLFRIAKNKWMDQLRSHHHSKVVPMEADQLPEQEDTAVEEHPYLAAVRRHFGDLGDNCKKILGLFYFRNESMKRIAEEMGWTEQTARNNKYRCLEKLRTLIHNRN